MEQQIEDEGRPVPPHRSGGGHRIAIVPGAGRGTLALAAALAMAGASIEGIGATRGRTRIDEFPGNRPQPDNRGRRAEKDAAALAKADAKRQRKAAKRAAKLVPNDQGKRTGKSASF